MGVPEFNPGTLERRRELSKSESFIEGQRKSVKKARDPERRRKISESKKGKPRPRHVIEAMTRGRIEAAKRRRLKESNAPTSR
jgi:hypothetical protein